jgi:hypothetical protein
MSRAMTYRYPWRAMLPDYARAALGMACTVTPLLLMDLSVPVSGVLAFLAMIFTLFAGQAVLRHATRILVSERAICAHPVGGRIPCENLTRLKLAYFSVRRDGRRGWMELKVQSGRRTLRIDSRLQGFTEVVRQAAAAAKHACIELDASTLSNLATLDGSAQSGAAIESRMREHG